MQANTCTHTWYKYKHTCTHHASSHRMCYKTSTQGDVCNPDGCIARLIPRTSFGVRFIPSSSDPDVPTQTKIWSQGNLRGRNYRNQRYCQYHVSCPPGQLLHFGYRTGKMEIEPANPANGLCLDYVTIENFSEENTQLCGSHPETTRQRDGPLRVEFRSNTRGQFPGFLIDVLCVNPKFSNLPGCRASSDANSTNRHQTPSPDRRRRGADHEQVCLFLITGQWVHNTVAVCILYNNNHMLAMKACTIIHMQVKRSFSMTTNRVKILRNGGLEYTNYRVEVIVDGVVVRHFLKIEMFIFWTRSKGTEKYYKGNKNYFHGSGVLHIVKNCAYYVTYDIPPQVCTSAVESSWHT